ncbi:hypothetical protein ABLE91_22160 [Aquabacter sp. CN5-332]|uniref:hypothetical protein n=1 Tax=Aquabacter sp. CN5-332 TaxID=3156608 RepID=UPI0032B5DE2D
MPLQNRVDPFGGIHAVPERGLFMGNRGGRIHDPQTRTLTGRSHASRRWICCVLSFKGRRRAVMGRSYTELFFMDEVVALAAGHRPCFECRRAEAKAFAAAWGAAEGVPPPDADAMDLRLHKERRPQAGWPRLSAADLPDGAVYAEGDATFAVKGDACLRFGFAGWRPAGPRPERRVAVITPPSILGALRNGYVPHWHPSASRT